MNEYKRAAFIAGFRKYASIKKEAIGPINLARVALRKGVPWTAKALGKRIVGKTIPKAIGAAGQFAGQYLKQRALPVIGMSAGWTAGENIFKNLSEGKEITPTGLSDDFLRNLALFGAYDVGGAALGGLGPVDLRTRR